MCSKRKNRRKGLFNVSRSIKFLGVSLFFRVLLTTLRGREEEEKGGGEKRKVKEGEEGQKPPNKSRQMTPGREFANATKDDDAETNQEFVSNVTRSFLSSFSLGNL